MPGRLLKFVVFAAMVPATVLAHHGFGGRYDTRAPLYIEGVVVSAYFGQPHPEVILQTDPDATVPASVAGHLAAAPLVWPEAEAAVEFPPIRAFFALDGRVAVGDRVAIIALRNCDPPHQLRGQWIRTAQEYTAEAGGRVQAEVEGC